MSLCSLILSVFKIKKDNNNKNARVSTDGTSALLDSAAVYLMVDKNITVLNYKTIALATEYLMNVTTQYHFQATRMAPSHVLRLVLKKVKFSIELSYRSWK